MVAAFDDNAQPGGVCAMSSRGIGGPARSRMLDNFPAPLAKLGDLPFAPGFEPASDKLDTIAKVSLIIKFL